MENEMRLFAYKAIHRTDKNHKTNRKKRKQSQVTQDHIKSNIQSDSVSPVLIE